MNKSNLLKQAEKYYRFLNWMSRDWLSIFVTMGMRFGKAYATEAAAGMTYYIFFAIFPTLISVVVIGSFFLEEAVVQNQLLFWVEQLIPDAGLLVEDVLMNVISQRGTASIISIVGLVWAAGAAYLALARNVNRAWPDIEKRNVIKDRLVAVVTILVLVVLIILSVVSNALLGMLAVLQVEFLEAIADQFLTKTLPFFFPLLMFYVIYRWVPNTKVTPFEALVGALFSMIGWYLANFGFGIYIKNFANYQLVYGTISAVIVFLLWLFISSAVVLLGAHLSVSVAIHKRLDDPTLIESPFKDLKADR